MTPQAKVLPFIHVFGMHLLKQLGKSLFPETLPLIGFTPFLKSDIAALTTVMVVSPLK